MARRVEQVEDTRRAILAAARHAFVEKGFSATSLEDIVTPARLTKGALYHHFESKAAVLEALYIELSEQLASRVAQAMDAAGDDPWQQLIAALDAFFAGSSEPDYVRLVLLEAPRVLGTDHGREIDQGIGLGLVCELVQSLRDAGLMPDLPVVAIARLLLAATGEFAITMAHADDPAAVRRDGTQVILAVLDGLRASAERGPRPAPRPRQR